MEALELYEGNASALSMSRSPEIILDEAGKAAKALKDVVVKTKAAIMLGTSEHLKCEAWQTLGHFYGLTGRIKETRFVEFGGVVGFQAFAELVHVKTGAVVSTAESMCLNDEDKWSSRPKYQWVYVKRSGGTSTEDPGKDEIVWEDNPKQPGKKIPKKQRVQLGDERVPLFQLMSMAQTRALSKVHSNALRWVVVLAGYNPTPAEEVDGQNTIDDSSDNGANSQPPPPTPQRKSQSQANGQSAPSNPGPGAISEKQMSRLWAIGFDKKLSKEKIQEIIGAFGFKHASEVTKAAYDRVVAAIEKGEVPSDDGDPLAERIPGQEG